jgi:hypothetical protein
VEKSTKKPNPPTEFPPLSFSPTLGRWQRTKPFFHGRGKKQSLSQLKKIDPLPSPNRRGLGRGGERFSREVFHIP